MEIDCSCAPLDTFAVCERSLFGLRILTMAALAAELFARTVWRPSKKKTIRSNRASLVARSSLGVVRRSPDSEADGYGDGHIRREGGQRLGALDHRQVSASSAA